MTSLLIRGSLGQIMANHELVDILEETTAWDLLHLTSAPPMMPTASLRRQQRHQAGYREPGSPSLWEAPAP